MTKASTSPSTSRVPLVFLQLIASLRWLGLARRAEGTVERNSRVPRLYRHWRDAPTRLDRFNHTPPYKLSLGANLRGRPLLPFHEETGSNILVTKPYVEMFCRVLRLRKTKGMVTRGAARHWHVAKTRSPSARRLTGDLFFRENYLLKVHACTTDFRLSGGTTVRQL